MNTPDIVPGSVVLHHGAHINTSSPQTEFRFVTPAAQCRGRHGVASLHLAVCTARLTKHRKHHCCMNGKFTCRMSSCAVAWYRVALHSNHAAPSVYTSAYISGNPTHTQHRRSKHTVQICRALMYHATIHFVLCAERFPLRSNAPSFKSGNLSLLPCL